MCWKSRQEEGSSAFGDPAGGASRVMKGAHSLQGGRFFSGVTIITHYISLNFRGDFCTGSSTICGGEFISDHCS